MSDSATARAQAGTALAQAAAALDEAATAFKRQARAAREGLVAASRARDAIRQAQLSTLGVVIENTHPEEGTENHDSPE
jgi:hypothetical protein